MDTTGTPHRSKVIDPPPMSGVAVTGRHVGECVMTIGGSAVAVVLAAPLEVKTSAAAMAATHASAAVAALAVRVFRMPQSPQLHHLHDQEDVKTSLSIRYDF
ncbi:hypothetical protein GCM10027203_17650 [Nonomuraea fastidiosa]